MQFSLRDLVEKHNDIDISFSNTVTILNDVCSGLQYLHSRNPPIVHRDLTPNNILLCYHLRAKITDLGVARTLQATDTTKLTKAPGTHDFMPPECLVNKPVYGLPLDIFSFGGIILHITTRQWPTPAPWVSFDANTDVKLTLTSELQRRQQYLDKMTETYASLKPLVISCLDDNPKNRPTVIEVLTEMKKVKKASEKLQLYCDIWLDDKQKLPAPQSQEHIQQGQEEQHQQQQNKRQQNQQQNHEEEEQQQKQQQQQKV